MQLRWTLPYKPPLIILILIGLAANVYVALNGLAHLTLPTFLLIPAIVFGLHFHQQLSRTMRLIFGTYLVITIVIFSMYLFTIAADYIIHTPESDFTSFWLNGRVGIQGVNFYDPQYFIAAAEGMTLSDYFYPRLVESAFWYPPMTMLLFMPLGLFNMQTALILWNVVLLTFFILVVRQLHRMFLPDTGLLGIAAITALLVILYPTQIVVKESQTNYILLYFLLLMWQDREKPRAGLWLALAITIKPLVAPIGLCLLLWKHWRALVSLFAALAVLSLAIILFNGLETFLSYNPLSSVSSTVYNEPINQGLLATVLRLTDYEYGDKSPVTYPLFLIPALILTAVTAGLVYRLPKEHRQWSILLTMMLSLLIYPATLQHYGTFAIFPLLALWHDDGRYIGGTWGKFLFFTLIIPAFCYQSGYYSFYPYTLLWLLVVVTAVGKLSPNFAFIRALTERRTAQVTQS